MGVQGRSGAALALAILVASSCGGGSGPVPTPSATPSTTAAPSASASVSPAPTGTPEPVVGVVYFARDRLPPVGVPVERAVLGTTPEARIVASLASLFSAQPPAGLFNTTLISRARPVSASIDMDVATVDFAVPDEGWGTAGSAGIRAFVQQIVYTASEEPGVRRVLITENGHRAIIGGEGLIIDAPASREDVAGYQARPSFEPMSMGSVAGPRTPDLTMRWSVDQVAPALVRLVIDTGLHGVEAKAGLGFTVTPRPNDDVRSPELGKWSLEIEVPYANARTGTEHVGRTPLRTLRTTAAAGAVRYQIGLDDLRPWRVAMLYEPLRLVVDIGGDPDSISPNIAVYRPPFGGSVAPGFIASGLIRAFEARFQYRVTAYDGTVLVSEFGVGSLGTSELWGTFEIEIPAVPATGGMLEIVLRSPRDGAVAEQVSIPVSP